MNGSMMRHVAASCHSPRNAANTANWTISTLVWRNRSDRRNCACRSDTAPRASIGLEGASLNIQILPYRLAIGPEFGRIARIHRRPFGGHRECDVVDILHLGR